MKYLKTTLLLTFSLFLFTQTYAQVAGGSPEFQKLFDMYAMDRIEDCLWKADKYTDKESTRRSPEPYLYMSMCYFKIHNNVDKYDEEIYKRPLKEALKYAYKFVKKDKENQLVPKNQPYLKDIMKAGMQEANFYAVEENYRKSAYFLKKVIKIDDSDPATLFALGLHQFLSRNRGEGARNIKAGLEKIQAEENLTKVDIHPSLEPLITKGVLVFKDMEKMNDQNDELTEKTVSISKRLFSDDEMFLAQLNGEKIERKEPEEDGVKRTTHYSEGIEE